MAAAIIITASVVAVIFIVFFTPPGGNLFAPYQVMSTDATISPPASSYNISIGANNSNIELYQGGNNSIYIDLTVSGWIKLSGDNVYITENLTGNSLTVIIHTPKFLASATSDTKVYLPSESYAGYLSLATYNGNENIYGPVKAVNLSLTTSNGNIVSSGIASGSVEASSVNGNINIAASDLASATEDSVNGNLQLTVEAPLKAGTYSLNSVNGNQNIYISRNSNATLSASTVNGNVHVTNLPVNTLMSTSKELQGTVNGGGASILMKATNGNIFITGT